MLWNIEFIISKLTDWFKASIIGILNWFEILVLKISNSIWPIRIKIYNPSYYNPWYIYIYILKALKVLYAKFPFVVILNFRGAYLQNFQNKSPNPFLSPYPIPFCPICGCAWVSVWWVSSRERKRERRAQIPRNRLNRSGNWNLNRAHNPWSLSNLQLVYLISIFLVKP